MERFKEIRVREKLSVKQIADIMGVTVQAVGKWERGEGCPRADQLPKLAEAMNCTIDALFGRTDTA